MNKGHNFVLLETLRKDKDNSQNLLFADPLCIIVCTSPAEIQECFRQMERYRRKGYYLAGFFSYELGYFLEDALSQYCPKLNYPLFWFGVYRQPANPKRPKQKNQEATFYLSPPELAIGYPQYAKALHKIKNAIACGETYQINYTTRYHFKVIGNIFDFYDRLKQNQHVSYSALINHGGNVIVSLSPELFFRIDAGKQITVKPMKGTAPLDTPGAWLQNDPKNTSENVMIVDLLRSDLGRICEPGSVKVKKLFDVEKYKTLLQMTSTVTGRLRPQMNIVDIIKSLFPCGSVTGAPKIQSMKIIRHLEDTPRNIYTGAIGYFAPDGQAVFNVAIRTIDMQPRPDQSYDACLGVGGGIVYDSRPEEEFAECRLKAQFLINTAPDFALIATMLFTKGSIQYLSLHLKRLKASARYFKIPCCLTKLKDELKKYTLTLTGSLRLRLLLDANGDFTIHHQPLPDFSGRTPLLAVSRHRTNSSDPFLYHKTTRRNLYDDEFKQYTGFGYFDVLFLNERDEITEGAISNIFVRIRGRFYTPPLSCGLLPGIKRQIMIKKLNAREKILYLKDLTRADRIILTNAVRGATTVEMGRTNYELC